ncbi:MAG: hypothetical protein HFI42_06490 [Lachnospiraceae bacterium]|nr:hypothetical protein [Lachnospiraceae bacterium]MCI9150139.1 hypothetical protein [Lachnospiraceae bacterium]
MNELTKKIITGVIVFLVFVACVVLVVVGQRNIGAAGLLTQLLGVAGLVILLWLYNRQYK